MLLPDVTSVITKDEQAVCCAVALPFTFLKKYLKANKEL
jgi:hypothetical protein